MLKFLEDVCVQCQVSGIILGQGNIFTSVCHSVYWGVGVVGFPACITGHMTRGRESASWGGGGWTLPRILRDTVNKWAVRILLEWILVFNYL